MIYKEMLTDAPATSSFEQNAFQQKPKMRISLLNLELTYYETSCREEIFGELRS